MKIQITKATVANRKDVYVGDIIETDDNQGNFLIRIGKAIKYVGPDDTEPELIPEPINDPVIPAKVRGRKQRRG